MSRLFTKVFDVYCFDRCTSFNLSKNEKAFLKHEIYFIGATISAPPTTNNPSSSSSNCDSKVPTIATTGAASKIIHPIEDISLEEIKARNPKYARNVTPKSEENIPSTSTSVDVNIMQTSFSSTYKAFDLFF